MKAISIRQPWAWLIMHGGKDVENRSWKTNFRGRVLVHAAKGMTHDEYIDADYFIYGSDIELPRIDDIECGGIIGSVEIIDCVTQSSSPWFSGNYGFVLRDPKALPFRPVKGKLGLFDVDFHEEDDAHQWDEYGERCLKCGDKDWFAGPECKTIIKGHACRPEDRAMLATPPGQELLACATEELLAMSDQTIPHKSHTNPTQPLAAQGFECQQPLWRMK